MNIRFVKMHGCGNDYIYIDAINQPEAGMLLASARWQGLVRRMSDRHTGIGGDGVIALCPPSRSRAKASAAHVRMRMFNADGSEGAMCGNGIRCVAKFAHDRLGIDARPIRVQTPSGVLSIDYRVVRGKLTSATVDMGRPGLELRQSGVRAPLLSFKGINQQYGVECGPTRDDVWIGTFVSMGNPHMVLFDDENPGRFDGRGRRGSVRGGSGELRRLDLARIGPSIENHPAFRDRMNVHFVTVQSRREATMRTWERGSGITLACGTGACAVLVAGALTGRLSRDALIHLPGGDLHIQLDKRSGHVFKSGPAVDVFDGVWTA